MELNRDDFKKWLRDTETHFNDIAATPSEIAEVAIACGFDIAMVRQWQISLTFKKAS